MSTCPASQPARKRCSRLVTAARLILCAFSQLRIGDVPRGTVPVLLRTSGRGVKREILRIAGDLWGLGARCLWVLPIRRSAHPGCVSRVADQ
eukprot:3641583-Pleurochrysis_carterae.AAC.1